MRLTRHVVVTIILMLVCLDGAAPAAFAERLRLKLNWIPNVQFAGILIAKEKGWYAEQGIDLEIESWKKGDESALEIASGRVDLGVVEGDALIRARDGGARIKGICAFFQRSPFCLMSRKEAGIVTPSDLRGKRVGFSSPESRVMIGLMLADAGLTESDVAIVQDGAGLELLNSGGIDAKDGFLNVEPIAMRRMGCELNVIPAYEHGYCFYSGVLAANEDFLDRNEDLVLAFLRTTVRGWKQAFDDPEGTARLILDKYHLAASAKDQEESLKLFRTLSRLGQGETCFGWMEAKVWDKGIESLYWRKIIHNRLNALDMFDLTLLRRVHSVN